MTVADCACDRSEILPISKCRAIMDLFPHFVVASEEKVDEISEW